MPSSSSLLLKSSLLLSLFLTFAAAAPKEVEVQILPFDGVVVSAAVLGTDPAGHTTYAVELEEVSVVATTTVTVAGTASASDVITSWRETATLVAGDNYISETWLSKSLDYACTFSGSQAVCEGYDSTGTNTLVLPTAAFDRLTLDVNAASVHAPSMVMAALGLMVSTVFFRLLA
ncbi:hypothetical protein C8F01DRAFT_1248343 [Mycena amicta]|nr:hypothetical protein C8F01DRAFT_1248343 [Mycena amicta]